jgi:hypothetical protein
MKLRPVFAVAAVLALNAAPAHAIEVIESVAQSASAVATRVEKAVVRGVKAAASGVERGAKAASHGMDVAARKIGLNPDAPRPAPHKPMDSADSRP